MKYEVTVEACDRFVRQPNTLHFNTCLVYERTNLKPLIRRAYCILWCVHTFQTRSTTLETTIMT